jgi:hypothetical protein
MHCQMFSHKINILLQALFDNLNLNGFPGAGRYTFGELAAFSNAIIAFRIKIWDKFLKNNSEGTGD